jgi:hypothetical protein
MQPQDMDRAVGAAREQHRRRRRRREAHVRHRADGDPHDANLAALGDLPHAHDARGARRGHGAAEGVHRRDPAHRRGPVAVRRSRRSAAAREQCAEGADPAAASARAAAERDTLPGARDPHNLARGRAHNRYTAVGVLQMVGREGGGEGLISTRMIANGVSDFGDS